MSKSKKVRVHELSKKLGVKNDELIPFIQGEGIEVKNHFSTLEEEEAALLENLWAERKGDGASKVEAPKAKAAPAPNPNKEKKESAPIKVESPVAEVKPAPTPKPKQEAAAPLVETATALAEKPTSGELQTLSLKNPIVVKELADAMDVKANMLIKDLLIMGVMANINQALDIDTANKVAEKYNFKIELSKRTKVEKSEKPSDNKVAPEEVVYDNAEAESRAPIVTFMGHVDHGKTSLQDALRKTNVVAGEAGAITQHLGASSINYEGQMITFIDTPGHAAFSAMRQRGANVTDIAILVVAADDGFMPQTREALKNARDAGVTIIVAINKCDLPAADIDKVLRQMMEMDLMAEDWGGQTAAIQVSALTGDGLDDLLERILLEAEVMELKANSKLPGQGVVLESQLEQGLGATASILVQNGTLKQGDTVICGPYYGRVKALVDQHDKRAKKAGPSQAVKLVGLNGVPLCGDKFAVMKNEREAKKLAAGRTADQREEQLAVQKPTTAADLFTQMAKDKLKTIKIMLKSDVQGTLEAIKQSLKDYESDKINLEVIRAGVGAITEKDVQLAASAGAMIIGFHVRTNPGVNQLAKRQEVEIKLYSIIYELLDYVKTTLEGELDPEYKENYVGTAEILQVFMRKKDKICGCRVKEGSMRVSAKARVYRDGDMIYNGDLSSLRRYQDDVKEVKAGNECGINLDNFNDFDIGDTIECYEFEEVKVSL